MDIKNGSKNFFPTTRMIAVAMITIYHKIFPNLNSHQKKFCSSESNQQFKTSHSVSSDYSHLEITSPAVYIFREFYLVIPHEEGIAN